MIKPGWHRGPVFIKLISWALACTWLAACATASASHQTNIASSVPARLSPTDIPDPIPGSTPTSTSTTKLSESSLTPDDPMRICSPFPGATRADLIASISNPYNPPPPGSDDPHQGIDLAVQQEGIALSGSPVLAVLSGSVAMVTADRFPYGYTLMVETPLEALPPDWMAAIHPPTPAPTRASNPALTCPAVTPEPPWNGARQSLYIVYAHLQEKAAFQSGDTIECSETIGRVGQSGNALNPHLHLEVRVGPAGARFSSMAHYDNTAQPEEMANYCIWRVSNVFQLIDPLRLLAQLP